VYIPGAGLLPLDTGVTPLSKSLAATSATSSSNGNNGGYPVTISGSGFPLKSGEATVSVCGKNAEITNINNIQIVFLMPSCGTNTGAQTITITSTESTGTATTTFSIVDGSATAPTIASLTPNSANPGIKGVIKIQGSNFGTNAADITLSLKNATGKVYFLKLLNITNT